MKKFIKIIVIIVGILFILQGVAGLYLTYEDFVSLADVAEELNLNNHANENELYVKFSVAIGFVIVGLLLAFFGNKIGQHKELDDEKNV